VGHFVDRNLEGEEVADRKKVEVEVASMSAWAAEAGEVPFAGGGGQWSSSGGWSEAGSD
jgi:hypothetical protein